MTQLHFSDGGLILPQQPVAGGVIVTAADLSERACERLWLSGLSAVVTTGLILSAHAVMRFYERRFDITAIIGILEYGAMKKATAEPLLFI